MFGAGKIKNKGFTLIELVVVIVILGILAVTAAPRFLNLQTDAKNSALMGLRGAIEGGIAMSFGKIALQGLERETALWSVSHPSIEEWCENCYFTYGYPGNINTTWSHLLDEVTSNPNEDADWFVGNFKAGDGDATNAIFSFKENFDGTMLISKDCYIRYAPATETTAYELELVPCQ